MVNCLVAWGAEMVSVKFEMHSSNVLKLGFVPTKRRAQIGS